MNEGEKMEELAEMEERLIALETKIAYQDNTIDILNEIVTKQQDKIDLLEKKLDALKEQLSLLAGSVPGSQLPDPPPPHY